MTSAALKAARGLVRDFGEVEQLQVSIKGPGEFVSTADLKAERTLRNELHRARPGYGLLFEEGGEVEAPIRATAGSSIRSMARPISCTGSRISRSRSRSNATAKSSPGSSTSRPATRCIGPRKAPAPI